MSRLVFVGLSLVAMTGTVFATDPSPGPLLGVVAGPWGLVASVVGYGAYRFYRTKR